MTRTDKIILRLNRTIGWTQPEFSGCWLGYYSVSLLHSLFIQTSPFWWGGPFGAVAGAWLAELAMVRFWAGRFLFHPRHTLIRISSTPYSMFIHGYREDVDAWCRDNCRGAWLLTQHDFIYMNRKSDFAMFLLFWSGIAEQAEF